MQKCKNHKFVNILWSENWSKKWKLFFIIKLTKKIKCISVIGITDIDDNVIEKIVVNDKDK